VGQGGELLEAAPNTYNDISKDQPATGTSLVSFIVPYPKKSPGGIFPPGLLV